MFYIGLYRENVKKSFCLKPRGLELDILVCSINKLTSTKFVQIMPLAPKMGLPWGSHVLYRENVKKNLSETTWPRALIFSMYHHLEDLYLVCSNYAPWGKNGPALEVTYFT